MYIVTIIFLSPYNLTTNKMQKYSQQPYNYSIFVLFALGQKSVLFKIFIGTFIFECFIFTLLQIHFQVVVLSWVYGIDRVFDNLSQMNMKLSGSIRVYWWITWMLATPITAFVSIITISIHSYKTIICRHTNILILKDISTTLHMWLGKWYSIRW